MSAQTRTPQQTNLVYPAPVRRRAEVDGRPLRGELSVNKGLRNCPQRSPWRGEPPVLRPALFATLMGHAQFLRGNGSNSNRHATAAVDYSSGTDRDATASVCGAGYLPYRRGLLFLHGGVAEARIRYMPPRNVRQVSLIPDIGFATYASPIDNSIIRRHAVMTFASGYMKLQINFSCENFHEDTTSDHTDGNGATI
jgi:hypothetical protein